MTQEVQHKNIKKTLGSRIREERLRNGWTIEALAEMVNLSPSFLGSVERGERALSIEKLYSISVIFNVSIDSLVKSSLPANSRVEVFSSLTECLSDSEFNSIYDIMRTVVEHFKVSKKA